MQSDPSNLVFILNFNGLNTFAGGRRIKNTRQIRVELTPTTLTTLDTNHYATTAIIKALFLEKFLFLLILREL